MPLWFEMMAKKGGYYLGGSTKRRPTNEGGAPRKATNDTDGIPVRPINVATEETTSRPEGSAYLKWAHENKPRMRDAMMALAILKHLAWLNHGCWACPMRYMCSVAIVHASLINLGQGLPNGRARVF